MSDLESAVGRVVVADEAQAVGADGHGGVLTDIACVVQGGKDRGSAGLVGTVGHLETAVGHVVIADETQAVGPDGQGGVLADVTEAIQCGEGQSCAFETGIVRSDTDSQSEA